MIRQAATGPILGGALLVVAVLVGSARAEEKASLVNGNAAARTGALDVYGGALVLREGQAGGAFAVIRLADKGELPFFLVLKHGFSNASSSESSEDVKSDGESGEVRQNLTLDGRTMSLTYRIDTEKGRKVLDDSLAINAKTVDLRRGRVLLVDLTAAPITWKQKKLDLPRGGPNCTGRGEAEEMVKKTLAALAKQDKEVQAFIEGK